MEPITQLDPSSDYRTARNIREKRRIQASALIPGALLVVIGAWALLAVTDGAPPALWQMGALLFVGFGLSLLVRFLVYGRTEPGLMFVGSAITLAAAASLGAWYILAADAPEYASLPALWPVGLGVVGAAFLLTWLFSRRRDRRLILPGLGFITAGAAALPFTMGFVPPLIVEWITVYWPLIFGVVGLVALTSVLRRRETAESASERA